MKVAIKKIINHNFHLNIQKLKLGRNKEIDRFSYQKQYINFDIKEQDKVLDIGSGGHPFPLATHLADFYEFETTHRSDELKRDHRPFTACNVESTPFTDKEFDFVYCSHVLEHVENPAKACEELMRISKRGYIETPTKTSDIMFNFARIPNHHKWHTQLLADTLVFIEWVDKEKRDIETNYFYEQFHSQWANPFQDLVYKHRDLFYCMMLWESNFNYLVINKKGVVISSNL